MSDGWIESRDAKGLVPPGTLVWFIGGALVRVTRVGSKFVEGINLGTGRKVKTQLAVRVAVDPPSE